jgi:AcrR family transcriptional regulator
MPRPSNRDHILDAAEAELLERGAWRLTLDAVAKRAEVSKGGLLYHFPSKDDLLRGMVTRLLEEGRARRLALRAEAPEDPETCLRASIAACLLSDQRNPQLGAAIIAALALSPGLMDAVRAHNAQRFRDLTEMSMSWEEGALVLLAVDGLMLLEILNVSPFSETEREKLIAAMQLEAHRIAEHGAPAKPRARKSLHTEG